MLNKIILVMLITLSLPAAEDAVQAFEDTSKVRSPYVIHKADPIDLETLYERFFLLIKQSIYNHACFPQENNKTGQAIYNGFLNLLDIHDKSKHIENKEYILMAEEYLVQWHMVQPLRTLAIWSKEHDINRPYLRYNWSHTDKPTLKTTEQTDISPTIYDTHIYLFNRFSELIRDNICKEIDARHNPKHHRTRNDVREIFFYLCYAYGNKDEYYKQLFKAEEYLVRWQIAQPHALAVWGDKYDINKPYLRYNWDNPARPILKTTEQSDIDATIKSEVDAELYNHFHKIIYIFQLSMENPHFNAETSRNNFFNILYFFKILWGEKKEYSEHQKEIYCHQLNKLHEVEECLVSWQFNHPRHLIISGYYRELATSFLRYDWLKPARPRLREIYPYGHH